MEQSGETPTEQAFRDRLKEADVSPLWDVLANLVTQSPQPRAVPHRWAFADLRAHLMQAGEMITAEQAERRVLILENPGTAGDHTVTDALYGGLQLVLPGETAPVHRHTQSALRFVLESNEAWTSVDGEPVAMHPFDLVLTPSWRWHEHGGADTPTIWLDGLDIPTIQHFSAGFAEREGNAPATDMARHGSSRASFGSNLRPVQTADVDTDTPLFHFPYAVWRGSLETFAQTTPVDPHRGWMLEFTNPKTGGAVMNTISAFAQWVPAGMKTKMRRQTAGTVIACVDGSGTITVDGAPFEVMSKDIVAVPSWAGLEIEAAGSNPLILFSYSDQTCHEKLGFWKEALA